MSEIQYAEKNAGASGGKAPSLIALVQKAIARRAESATQFRSGSREDLAKKEDEEATLLKKFLPKQMDVEELEKVVEGVLRKMQEEGKDAGGNAKKMAGMVIREVNAQVDRATAPGSFVSQVVNSVLEKRK